MGQDYARLIFSGKKHPFSKLQRRTRRFLCGQLQLNVGRADVMELLGHDVMRKLGLITFAAQVGEIEMAQIGGHDLRGGFRGGFIGEMTVAAEDALFQTPGAAWTVLKHLHIVIGLQYQHIRGTRAFDHQFGHVAEVGDEPDVAGRGVNQKPDRVLGVVRNGEGVHQQVGDFEARAGFKQVAVEFSLELKFKRLLGGTIAVNRDVQLSRDAGQAVNVVAVFVGDEDGGEIFRRAPEAGQALADLARAEPGVHEHAGFVGFDISAIAGGTAAEDGEFDGHRWTLIAWNRGGKFFHGSAKG